MFIYYLLHYIKCYKKTICIRKLKSNFYHIALSVEEIFAQNEWSPLDPIQYFSFIQDAERDSPALLQCIWHVRGGSCTKVWSTMWMRDVSRKVRDSHNSILRIIASKQYIHLLSLQTARSPVSLSVSLNNIKLITKVNDFYIFNLITTLI